MDDARFDDLTRILRRLSDRRAVALAFPGIFGLAALGGVLNAGDAEGKKKKKRCKKNQKRCGKKKCVKGNCCPGKSYGGDPECTCARTTEGATFCVSTAAVVCLICESSDECNPGQRCVKGVAEGPCCFAGCGAPL